MASSRSSARSLPSRPIRQSRTPVLSYQEDTTSDEELEESNERAGSSSLRSRNTAKRRSYREPSTDESMGEFSDDLGVRAESVSGGMPKTSETATARRESRNFLATTTMTASAELKRPRNEAPKRPTKRRPPRTKLKKLGQPLKKKIKVTPQEELFIRSDVIPRWQDLPYHILVEIFLHAFYPLDDPKIQSTKNSGKAQEAKSVKTLLEIALMCRRFSEPALAALYYSPPVFSAYSGHGLLKLLSMPPSSLSINYAAKVKELCIDAETVLTLKSGPALGYFDIHQLLQKTPRLRTLRLYHREDVIFGHPPIALSPAKWNYSERLFNCINDSRIMLRDWEWNGRFMDPTALLTLIFKTHYSPSFQTIKNLRLVHLFNDQDDSSNEDVLAVAIKALPELECLEFHECPIMSGAILEHLPPTLRSLTISNCDRLLSSHITKLFKSHGNQLRELTLNHNRHMSMEFMPDLGIACPQLEVFRVDVSMFDTSSYHDLEPHFPELISLNQRPTWPDGIREIELYQLRHWDTEAGEMFFNSLIEAAPDMKDLRRLDINAIISVDWRDRARFRERWFHRFEKVFLRRSPPPDPNLRSLSKRPLASSFPSFGKEDVSCRVAVNQSPPTRSKRHSSRISQRKIPESIVSEDSSMLDSDAEFDIANYHQGMCEHISIRIDNQRPKDHQFQENDFLDDEPSDDEDWNGEDFDPEHVHAY
ncbi:hypothetical protein N7493_005425 [Penicillium malachiteum]|uniref:F-box domain-containing protein n=1 Tax=Penicillium malachiteum TaxID=1324776 RepID=A0AAD6MWH7_9EURO|nr:hypothetical protein N7493_005425 [Penicillium malachiteum]